MLSSYLLVLHSLLYLPFFFTRPATTEIYTLSLHDALPISALEGRSQHARLARRRLLLRRPTGVHAAESGHRDARGVPHRSEEHTSELQSHSDLVCRLLLEKKKKKENSTTHCLNPITFVGGL